MTDVTPANAAIQEESVTFRAAASEAAMFAIGGAINYALQQLPLKATVAALNALTARVNNAKNIGLIYSLPVTQVLYSQFPGQIIMAAPSGGNYQLGFVDPSSGAYSPLLNSGILVGGQYISVLTYDSAGGGSLVARLTVFEITSV